MYNNLRHKLLLRYEYESNMDYYNVTFRKTLIHFLKFDYLSLKTERKKYLPIFDEIRTLKLY